MPFTISGFLSQIITGWGLTEAAVLAEADRIAALFPDIKAQEAKLTEWFHAQVSGLESTAYNTVSGVVMDILAAKAGVNPKAWQSSV